MSSCRCSCAICSARNIMRNYFGDGIDWQHCMCLWFYFKHYCSAHIYDIIISSTTKYWTWGTGWAWILRLANAMLSWCKTHRGDCAQRLIAQTIFYHNSYSMGIWFCCNSMFSRYIATKFSTCHDSTAVVTCAKFCSDQMIIFWMRGKLNFHKLWQKNIVKWAIYHRHVRRQCRLVGFDCLVLPWVRQWVCGWLWARGARYPLVPVGTQCVRAYIHHRSVAAARTRRRDAPTT